MEKNSKHVKYLKFLAGTAATQEPVSKARLSALIVSNSNIPVALGANSTKTHPLQARFSKNEHAIYLHAEIAAIAKALKSISTEELSKCTLYVTRVLQDGSHAEAKPCPGCQGAIRAFGIKTVVWTTDTGFEVANGEDLNETNALYDSRKAENSRKRAKSNNL